MINFLLYYISGQPIISINRSSIVSDVCYLAGSCFVKFSRFEDADRAIEVLDNQYTFSGVIYLDVNKVCCL